MSQRISGLEQDYEASQFQVSDGRRRIEELESKLYERERDLRIAVAERRRVDGDIEDVLLKHEGSKALGYEAALHDIREGLASLRDVDVATITKVTELLDRLEDAKREG